MKKTIHKNKKAFHDYQILQTYEAGILLKGHEIKSIRKNNVNLKNSFCKIFKGEVFIFEMHIGKYENSTWNDDHEKRKRKLLLHRKEIDKIQGELSEYGKTLIPLYVYINDNNKCKIQVGVCKGLKKYDKRKSEKERTVKRDIKRDFGKNI